MTGKKNDDAGRIAETPSGPRTLGFVKYIWITLAVVVVTQGAIVAIEKSYRPSGVRAPQRALADLPTTVAAWTGKDSEHDPRIFATLGADQLVNRIYKNSAGEQISMSCATWLSTSPGMPHSPELCYPSAGWELAQSHTVALPGRPEALIAIQTYRHSGQRVTVAFWYQMDNWTFVDWNGGRLVRRKQYGGSAWSPLTKTLLQTDDTPDAEKNLLEIAAPLYEFNRGL